MIRPPPSLTRTAARFPDTPLFRSVGGRSTGLWLDHMPDLELKLTWRLAFLSKERGNSPLMDCMWNIWSGENAKLPLDKRFCAAEPLDRKSTRLNSSH